MKEFMDYIMQRQGLRNISQLSKRLGVSHVTVSRWLDGSDKPSVPSCRKLSELSGCPLEYIIILAYGKG